jgi:hypothetical protein
MNQDISSMLTTFYKFIEPLFGVMIVAVILFGGFFPPEIPMTVKSIFITFAIGSSIAMWFFSWPLKKVSIEGETLLVSDYFQDTMVPIGNIDRVEESYAFRRRRIILYLKEPCQFGERIVFVPKMRFDSSILKGYTSEKKLQLIKKRKPLPEALRAYWFYLIGIAVFPFLLVFGTEAYKIPFDYFIAPFFMFSVLAAWPCLSGKASYAFWIIAIISFMVGGMLAAFFMQFLKPVAG